MADIEMLNSILNGPYDPPALHYGIVRTAARTR
jgi:hypothetical protein